MSEQAIFTSERLIYRPYHMGDISALVKLCNEKTYRRWFYFLPKMNEARAKEQIGNNMALWSRDVDLMKDNCTLAVVKKDGGELIGSVGISKYHGKKKLKDIEVAFDIGEAHQNKGYATEAAIAIVNWGLPRLAEIGETPKIVGKAEHKNFASRRTLEKAGFAFTRKEFFCHVYEINGQVG